MSLSISSSVSAYPGITFFNPIDSSIAWVWDMTDYEFEGDGKPIITDERASTKEDTSKLTSKATVSSNNTSSNTEFVKPRKPCTEAPGVGDTDHRLDLDLPPTFELNTFLSPDWLPLNYVWSRDCTGRAVVG